MNRLAIFGFLSLIVVLNSGCTGGQLDIHEAAEKGDTSSVRWLLDDGVNIERKDSNDLTPLDLAAEAGRTKTARFLISQGARESIHAAAALGDLKVVDAKLAAGASVNARNWQQETPLHWAALNGQLAVAKRLLSKGALVNSKNAGGATPLQYAANHGQSAMVDILLKNGASAASRDATLFTAVNVKNTEIIDQLLKSGANINVGEGKDATPLHSAVYTGWINGVVHLLSKGAKINVCDNRGRTPLYIAVDTDWLKDDMANVLIFAGADPNTLDKQGYNPMHVALRNGKLNLVTLMLSRGGRKDYWLASGLGDVKSVRQYLDNGIDVNKHDGLGYTGLHWAALGGSVDVATLFIDRGADINAKNPFGFTPLHVAVRALRYPLINETGSTEVAELLIRRGANVTIKSQNGNTALYYADFYGFYHVAALLRDHGSS